MVVSATGCGQGAWSGSSNSKSGPRTAHSHACRCDVQLFQMHTVVMGAPSATMAAAESRLQQCQATPAHGVPHRRKCIRRSRTASVKSGRYWAMRWTIPHASKACRHHFSHTPNLEGIHRLLVLRS